ncbi:hypothetical protein MTR67_051947 [Solanum verrucosum]|uniref:Chromo domain-containing protein n=1 Tax=Solanum verrucosum TaxID=315347 RepID=A0AAF0ZZJ2_SOLVR|nr:hypothetical protein MTR67_051947 [Solanum verrucosum]
MGDPSLLIPTKDIGIKDNLSYDEIHVEILDRQVRKLRIKEVASVKVLWKNQFVEEGTWEVEEDMKKRISKRISNVAYELELLQDLAAVHPDSLSYEEIPVKILDRQVCKLRTKEVASVKVLWRS